MPSQCRSRLGLLSASDTKLALTPASMQVRARAALCGIHARGGGAAAGEAGGRAGGSVAGSAAALARGPGGLLRAAALRHHASAQEQVSTFMFTPCCLPCDLQTPQALELISVTPGRRCFMPQHALGLWFLLLAPEHRFVRLCSSVSRRVLETAWHASISHCLAQRLNLSAERSW